MCKSSARADHYPQKLSTWGKHSTVPVILYFHGGAFTSGTLDDGDIVASFIAKATPAWVISVGYSLAPQFPFPHATEDGYRALLWAVSQAGAQRADPRRVGLAGHDAGGNIATCVAAIARDRSEVLIGAQVLIAPLLDPSMTRVADEADAHAAFDLSACARLLCGLSSESDVASSSVRSADRVTPPLGTAARADLQRSIGPTACRSGTIRECAYRGRRTD